MTVLWNAWGYEVTAAELAAVLTSLLAIALGIRGTRWAWPFYFLASLTYAWLFVQWELLGSAALQTVFMAAAIWGWFGWGEQGVRAPGRLAPRHRLYLCAAVAVAWVLAAPVLQAFGGVATWADAFVFVGSVAAQVLMVLEYVEAWPLWAVVDVVGALHYASQGLWFTALLYAILVVMALTGWRAWQLRSAHA